jgi:hypothetical protein
MLENPALGQDDETILRPVALTISKLWVPVLVMAASVLAS